MITAIFLLILIALFITMYIFALQKYQRPTGLRGATHVHKVQSYYTC